MSSVPTRPLIVFTGQGISRADGFDLEGTLRRDERLRECFETAPGAATLDDVFSACRPREKELVNPLLIATYHLCRAWWRGGLVLANHQRVFEVLAEAARTRAVVHLTTNLDGGTTRIASRLGARWRPLAKRSHVRDIVRDVAEVLTSGHGMCHFPLHGEAGLLAVKGADYDGARLLYTSEEDRTDDWWTLNEGVGTEVRLVERRMALSQWGYGLLRSLLTGSEFRVDEVGVVVPPLPPAELLVIGYGAWSLDARDSYPFEKIVADAGPQDGARTALHHKSGEKALRRSVEHFWTHGFAVADYGDDVGAAVRHVVLGR